jgi:hypothetical protein
VKLYPVVFICRTCEQFNSQELGTERFEVKQTEFESLTDASQHLMRYDHHMDAVVKEEEINAKNR